MTSANPTRRRWHFQPETARPLRWRRPWSHELEAIAASRPLLLPRERTEGSDQAEGGVGTGVEGGGPVGPEAPEARGGGHGGVVRAYVAARQETLDPVFHA